MTKASLLCAALLLAACSTFQTGGTTQFKLRPFQEEKLANGLRILWIQDDSLPRISLNMMIETGSIDEEPGKGGVNALTADLLDQGTAKRDAPQLADDLDQIGAEFNHSAGADFTTLTSTGLAPTKDELLGLYSEIILTPSFKEAEVNRKKSVVMAGIQKNQDQPSAFADEAEDREIFGSHPYGSPVVGTLKSVKELTRTDLLRFYQAYYRPNNAILSVVGQFDDAYKARVRQAFEKWQAGEIVRPKHAAAALREGRTVLISKTGLQQTQVRMGHVGIPRSNKDFLTLRMANVILGGAFASRLNQKIRDDLGLTYSIHSGSDARLEPGSFEISTFTRHEKTADTILETQKLVKSFVENGVTDEELAAGKALLIGQFPAALETADRLAFNLMVLRRYGIGDDYLTNFQRNIQKMTKAEVNETIRRNIHPEKMQIVIYSDEKALNEQLKRLGQIDHSQVRVE